MYWKSLTLGEMPFIVASTVPTFFLHRAIGINMFAYGQTDTPRRETVRVIQKPNGKHKVREKVLNQKPLLQSITVPTTMIGRPKNG